jgi:protein required for attachment to host cells
MLLPTGATVAVADGEKLILFHNTGHDGLPQLTVSPSARVDGDHRGADPGHHSSPANPNHGQPAEDGFSVGVADLLNRRVLAGTIADLVVIAPPRALGELRKHYSEQLSKVLRGEIAKELTGHTVHDIEKAIEAA